MATTTASSTSSHMRDVVILGFGFLFLFAGFSVIMELSSTELPSLVAFWGLGSVYLSFAVSNLFVSTVVSKLGLRTSIVCGSLAFQVYVFVNIAAVSWLDGHPSQQLAALVPGGVLLGFGTSMVWNAQGAYLTIAADSANLAKYNGVFFFLFILNGVLGNVTAAVLSTFIALTKVYWTLFGIGVIGTGLFTLLRPISTHLPADSAPSTPQLPKRGSTKSLPDLESGLLADEKAPLNARLELPSERVLAKPRAARTRSADFIGYGAHTSTVFSPPRTKNRPSQFLDSSSSSVVPAARTPPFVELFKTLVSRRILFLIPLIWFVGFSQAFIYGNFPLYITTTKEGSNGLDFGSSEEGSSVRAAKLYMMAIFAGTSALVCLIISRYVDKLGRRLTVFIGGLSLCTGVGLLIFCSPENNYLVLFCTAILFALGDGVFQTVLSIFTGHLFADRSVAGFAAFNLFEAISTGVAFFTSNAFITENEAGLPLPRLEMWAPILGGLFAIGFVLLLVQHRWYHNLEASDVEDDTSSAGSIYTNDSHTANEGSLLLGRQRTDTSFSGYSTSTTTSTNSDYEACTAAAFAVPGKSRVVRVPLYSSSV